MKRSLLLLLLYIPFLSAFPQQIDGELYNLTKIKNGYRSKRISSYDKNGYNGDRIVGIKPNEKVTICDIQGAGIINHIWFTIAPPPHLVNRNTPIRDKIAISCMLRQIHESSSHAIRHGLYIKNRKRLFCP